MSNIPAIKQDRIIKRFGGRHLIFRTKLGGSWFVPRPYILVSNFRGPIWFFYGIGQIWITHKKIREINGWIARAPRFVSQPLIDILDPLVPQLQLFIQFCNANGIQGTIAIERKVIEFHWTFGQDLEREKLKQENSQQLDQQFHELVDAFLLAVAEIDRGQPE